MTARGLVDCGAAVRVGQDHGDAWPSRRVEATRRCGARRESGSRLYRRGVPCGSDRQPGVNLDSWAMPPGCSMRSPPKRRNLRTAARPLFVIEGVMGLFDGVAAGPPGRCGTTADLAARFRLPVLLVIDVAGQSQTAAALVRGLATHDPAVRIAGVVLNRVGSERHRGSWFRTRSRRSAFRCAGRSRAMRRSRCRNGISASSKRASTAISPSGLSARRHRGT